jgi:hypothetical protein
MTHMDFEAGKGLLSYRGLSPRAAPPARSLLRRALSPVVSPEGRIL